MIPEYRNFESRDLHSHVIIAIFILKISKTCKLIILLLHGHFSTKMVSIDRKQSRNPALGSKFLKIRLNSTKIEESRFFDDFRFEVSRATKYDNMHIKWKRIWRRIHWCQNYDVFTYTKLFFHRKTKINYFYIMIHNRWVIYESYHMNHVPHSKENSIFYRMVIR